LDFPAEGPGGDGQRQRRGLETSRWTSSTPQMLPADGTASQTICLAFEGVLFSAMIVAFATGFAVLNCGIVTHGRCAKEVASPSSCYRNSARAPPPHPEHISWPTCREWAELSRESAPFCWLPLFSAPATAPRCQSVNTNTASLGICGITDARGFVRTTGTSSSWGLDCQVPGGFHVSNSVLGFVRRLPAGCCPAWPVQTGAGRSPVTTVCTSGPSARSGWSGAAALSFSHQQHAVPSG
jgi:hypothetical protein